MPMSWSKLLLVSNVVLIVAFVVFASLHIAWYVYIWRFDYQWKYAQAIQRECEKNTLERDTVRWNMMNISKSDRTLRSLQVFTFSYIGFYITLFIIASAVIINETKNRFAPSTTSIKLEWLQSVPTIVYVTIVSILFLIVTASMIAKHFGRNPRNNKLKGWMKPYTDSLINVKRTLAMMKKRTQSSAGQYDREQELKDLLVKRIAMVKEAESTEMGESIFDSLTTDDLIGYIQFANDLTATALCRYVKDDITQFSVDEFETFSAALLAFFDDVLTTRINASDASANAQFGHSVAIATDGKTMAVGAPTNGTNAGAVYVMTLDPNNSTWKPFVKLTSNPPNRYFGKSVALSANGSILAVGKPMGESGNYGSVDIFMRSDTNTYEKVQTLTATQPSSNMEFGNNIALSANGVILAVGAQKYNNDKGAVYMYVRSSVSQSWVLQQQIQISNGNRFGKSLAISSDGNTLVIGNTASAYVYQRESNNWAQKQRFEESENRNGFGTSVSISSNGKVLAISAATYTTNEQGYVYIYAKSGDTWALQSRLQSSDHSYTDMFGIEVKLSPNGEMCAVGAFQDDHSSKTQAGSVYIFSKFESTWTEKRRLQASDPESNDWFGVAMAISDLQQDGKYTLVVGAKTDDHDNKEDAGSVYVFKGSDNVWVSPSAIQTLQRNVSSLTNGRTYFTQYINSLSNSNMQSFMETWWDSTQRINGNSTLRLTRENYNTDASEEKWKNIITPSICQYWTDTWNWNEKLKTHQFGDPSSQLKPMMRDLKVYFGAVLVFIASIVYMYTPKGIILPLAFVAVVLVYLWAYLMQFV